MIDEVEEPGVGVMEVLEDHDNGGGRSEALEERPPCGEQLLRGDPGLEAEKGEEGGFDPAAFLGIGDVRRQGLGDPRPGRPLVIRLEQPDSATDHLAQGPETDPVAVGGRASVVPPHSIRQPIDVLEELPGETGLADAGGADDRHQPGAFLATCRVEQVLQEAEFVLPAHKGRLERLGAVPAADFRHDPQGAPGWHRGGLALECLLAGLLEDDRPRCGALRRLAHEDGANGSNRLEPARGVDEVARHHALVRRPERDRSLARQHAGPGLDHGPEGPHRVDELQARSDGSLCVILMRERRSPYRHHGVADELLHRPAIATDDVPGEVEIAAQQLPGLLRVAALGKRREPDEIGEEDRDEAAFSDRRGR